MDEKKPDAPDTPAPSPAPSPAPPAPAPSPPIPPPPSQETPEQIERKRCADVIALCNQVGKPELAADFIANGNPVADVQSHLFRVMCNERKPVDGGGGGANPAPTPDVDAPFKAEYAADRRMLMKSGITEADYIASRRITEGIDCDPGVVSRA